MIRNDHGDHGTCKEENRKNAGDDLEKLEPIVSSLLTVMAEYACDDLSQAKYLTQILKP